MPTKPLFRLFGIKYANDYVTGPFASQIISGKFASLYPKVVETYKNRDRTGLWISVYTNTTALKKTIRSKAARKVRIAFRDALAQRGYSAEGQSMDTAKQDLQGSIAFYPSLYLDIVNQTETLDKEMRALVAWMENSQLEKNKNVTKRVQAQRRAGLSSGTAVKPQLPIAKSNSSTINKRSGN